MKLEDNMLKLTLSKHVLFSFFAKLTSIAAQLYSFAIITKAFDHQDTGIWLLFFHLLFFFSFCDLGLGGSSLLNRLALHQAASSSLEERARFFFQRLAQALCVYGAVFFFLYAFATPLTQSLFSNSKYAVENLRTVFLVFSSFQLLKMPLNFWAQCLISCEKGYIKSQLEIVENVSMMALASTLFFFKLPLLQSLVSCAVVACALALVFFCITLYHLKWTPKLPSLSITMSTFPASLKDSFPFWIQNLLSTFLFSFSPFLVNHSLGIEYGSNYILSFKVCSLVIGIHCALLSPLSPFYTILFQRNDSAQAISKLKQSAIFSCFYFACACLFIFFCADSLLSLWTGREIIFYHHLLPWMCLYGLINVMSTLLNALGKVVYQSLFLALGITLFYFITKASSNPSATYYATASWISLLPLLFSNIYEIALLRKLTKQPTENKQLKF